MSDSWKVKDTKKKKQYNRVIIWRPLIGFYNSKQKVGDTCKPKNTKMIEEI
jgi:hypothetical protein